MFGPLLDEEIVRKLILPLTAVQFGVNSLVSYMLLCALFD